MSVPSTSRSTAEVVMREDVARAVPARAERARQSSSLWRAARVRRVAPVSDERDDPRRQARVLRALATRLDAGGAPLPSDVFAQVERELELALDDEAIREAWAEQGDKEREPWVFARSSLAG